MTNSSLAAGAFMFALGLALGWQFFGDTNRAPTFGATGLPKNCRAIVASNIDSWRAGAYTAENALASIERNCGRVGYSWGR